MTKIILLRGNSGSGKSTIAKALQEKIGRGTLLISQDKIRREMLWEEHGQHSLAVDLLMNLVMYSNQKCDVAIVEGILYSATYSSLFKQIEELYTGQIFAYYFDISFEETLKRHSQKPYSHEFGEAQMRTWWREKDYLINMCEKKIHDNMSIDDIVELIYHDITH